MTQKKVTITDIAKASGVSKTTISRYLNGRFDLMSPETRRRIESVIDVSGYQPSTIARSLKNKHSLLLGIVVSDQSSPFSTAVLLGVGDALRNTEYVPVFVNCDDDPAKERYQISFLLSRGVDGLIVNTTSYENPFLVNLEARGVPVVLCDRYIKGHTFDIVTTDHDLSLIHISEEAEHAERYKQDEHIRRNDGGHDGLQKLVHKAGRLIKHLQEHQEGQHQAHVGHAVVEGFLHHFANAVPALEIARPGQSPDDGDDNGGNGLHAEGNGDGDEMCIRDRHSDVLLLSFIFPAAEAAARRLPPYGVARFGRARIWRPPHAASYPPPDTAASHVRHVFRPGHIRPAARF